jgi:Cu+-exporting ATPase
MSTATVENFRVLPGRGVSGTVGGRRLALGNRSALEEAGVDPEPLIARAEELRAEGQGVILTGCAATAERPRMRSRKNSASTK